MMLDATYLAGAEKSDVFGFQVRLHTSAWLPHELAANGYDRARYTLTKPLHYVSQAHGLITVPAGFETDLASIPRAAWSIIAPDDPAIECPSVVHDYVYSLQGALPNGQTLTRKEADELLVEAMETCGARWYICDIVHVAVRFGGASHWHA